MRGLTWTTKGLHLRTLIDIADKNFGNISEIKNGKINASVITIFYLPLAETLEIDPPLLTRKNKLLLFSTSYASLIKITANMLVVVAPAP